MSYVKRIASWENGAAVIDGTPAACGAGDYPEVHYDLARIGREVDRDALSSGPASLWRYAPLLSADDAANAVTLGEGWTPMLPTTTLGKLLGCDQLWAKDEGRNPSGTFKDRGASVAITRLRELGIETVIHNSSGNAAGALAMYAARAGIRCVNLVPMDVLPASLLQSAMSGADTIMLDGPWQQSGTMVAAAVARHGWFNVGTLKEPHRLEGKKTMGLEIAEQLGWTLPDAVVYPTGGGLGAVAIYKAFRELQTLGWVPAGPLPKLIVTQYEGCAPLVRAFKSGAQHAEVWDDLQVPPGGLKSTRPPGDRAVLKILRETGGAAVAVSGDDAVAAVGDVARTEGLFPCPEVGTTVAGLAKALKDGVVDRDARIVMMFTGSGLKSIPVLPDATDRTITAGMEI
ncbi:MAG: threonine synthase [Proteobacteria bacterium]|nr:threonine synthase [Pseudomonadota bacterium]